VQGSQPFDFASKKGTYVWSAANQTWNYTAGGDIIKIDYPKDQNSTTNDAELQISAYSEQQIGTDYYPTNIQAAIFTPIGTKQLSLALTAGYSSSGSSTEPNQASISLFINPYTISFSFDDTATNSTKESFNFSKGSTVYIAMNATATYASASDKTNGNPSAVNGTLQLENVQFTIAIDGTKASTAQSNNDFMLITVAVDGGTAGHVVWVRDQNGVQQAYIQYNDKSQQPLSTVFADLQTQLNSLG
jgi:hypothetical protein